MGGGRWGVGGQISAEVLQRRGEDESYAGGESEFLKSWMDEAVRMLCCY